MGELFNLSYCSSFATLFRSTLLERIQRNEHREWLDPLLRESSFKYFDEIASWKLRDVLDSIFSIVRQEYRCEYVYKNALAEFVLSDPHPVSAFSEFLANNSRADFVVANGTTAAYEIKTELDSLIRLKSQIYSYSCLFDEVYVVTHSGLSRDVMSLMDSHIGLLEFTDEGTLRKIRTAGSNKDRVNPLIIFNSLRRLEYTKILEIEFGKLPNLPNTQVYQYCRKLFGRLSPEVAHDHFAKALKERKKDNTLNQLIASAPDSLKALFLTSNLRVQELQAVQRRMEYFY